jgi:two-component system, OmpR family, alkaline phosphatase synthesis response regulator PhoP
MNRILLVEDELAMAEGICDALEHHGYRVTHAKDAEEGERVLDDDQFDLIVLDVMLPGKDGFEMCRSIRAKGVNVPVIMLTARSEEVDKVVGLELGADDYVTKPFSMRELIARIKVHLRRSPENNRNSGTFTFGDITVDFQSHKVTRNGEQISLTSTEFALLAFLIKERQNVLSRDKILNKVWGYTVYPDSRIVDTHILNLRKKLERDPHNPEFIKTQHGVGYKFIG